MRRHSYVTAVLAVFLIGCEASDKFQNKIDAAQARSQWQPTWANAEAALLRPGSKLFPSECTAGFLFVDPLTGLYYASTAAHCTDPAEGNSEDGTGVRIELDDFGEIGTVILDGDAVSPSVDFSLIELDPGINEIANPRVIDFQGPTGLIECTDTALGDSLGLYGHGFIFDTAEFMLAREGTLIECEGAEYGSAFLTDGGDSGAPVLHLSSSRALGMHTGQSSSGGAIGPVFPAIFLLLRSAGYNSVALATMDGGYVGGSGN